MLLFLTFSAITELPQPPTSLCVLVMDSQLSWLPVAKRRYLSPLVFTQLFTKSNCLLGLGS